MTRIIDLSGRRFGRLVVQHRAHDPRRGPRWQCACDCGQTAIVLGANLRGGHTTSCGCYLYERQRVVNLTHGHSASGSQSPEYRSWAHMVARCTNPKHKDFRRYGGRGIAVCKEWRESFALFLHCVGPRPSAGHSIDRIENARGYEPGNVRWATRLEQSRNQSRLVKVTIGSESMLVVDWIARTGMSRSVYHKRRRAGASREQVIRSMLLESEARRPRIFEAAQ